MTIRQVLLKLHLYVAFGFALPLIIVAVTGALLVYGDEIDERLHRDRHFVSETGETLHLQQLVDIVRSRHPDDPVMGVSLPQPGRSMTMGLRNRYYIHVNPYTGAILGATHLDDMARRKLFMLHSRMMAGEIGRAIVYWSTAFSLLMVATGIVLWWRRKVAGIKWNASWKRINFDLHNVLGLYPSIVLVILSVTGLIMAEGHPPRPVPQSTVAGGADRLSLDAAVAAAARRFPDARLTYVAMPNGPTAVYNVYAKFWQDPTVFGRSRVYVDQYSGRVIQSEDTRQASWAQWWENIVEPLHFGDVLGGPTRVIALLSCVFLVGQVFSGLLIWWNAGRRSAADLPTRRSARAAGCGDRAIG